MSEAFVRAGALRAHIDRPDHMHRPVLVRVVYADTVHPANAAPMAMFIPVSSVGRFGHPDGAFVLTAATTGDLNGPVLEERARQDAKWGPHCGHADGLDISPFHARHFPYGDPAREACEKAHQEGRGSWAHVLMEEVGEAFDEARAGDAEALEYELVQVEAVVRAWREALRARRGYAEASAHG